MSAIVVPQAFSPEQSSGIDGPEWLVQQRTEAADRFADAELPTTDLEEWRYSRIDDVHLEDYRLVYSAPTDDQSLVAGVSEIGDRLGRVSGRIVICDGIVMSVEIDDDLAAHGVRFGRIADFETATNRSAIDVSDPFDDLNTAFSIDPIVLQVPRGVVIEHPFAILGSTVTPGGASFPRVIVEAGEDSQFQLVEVWGSADIDALVVPRTSVDVGAAARVSYSSIQAHGSAITQLGAFSATVGQAATLDAVHSAMGGGFARMRFDCVLAGRGATGNLSALYFGKGDQMHDLRTFQTHEAPDTTSNLLFKGVLDDRARSVYTGLIRVGHEARGTNANQTNRNVKLSEEAWAESVPNLEIHQNDVKCSHASAVGPIDADQRFYLESRGVIPEVAERLVVAGFFEEVIDELPIVALAQSVREQVAEKLDTEATAGGTATSGAAS